MPALALGPLLRYVDERSATVWLEVDQPCTVRVLEAVTRTFTVHGHHYALVEIDDLDPGSSTPYSVELDGEQVWPELDSTFPPPRIRTLDPAAPLRLLCGSCRTSVPHDDTNNRTHGVDVLRAYAHAMIDQSEDEWPHLLLMLGDQVYADETSEQMREFIQNRRDINEPPGEELADFEEYTHLYRLAWTEPANRWLLSTLPSMMIFDDHDVRDDWNTSGVWREQMAAKPWWPARITGALASYWIYQHLGNLSPRELSADGVWSALRAHDGDAGALLDAFARQANTDPDQTRWSYSRDIGGVRLLVLDCRGGRVLEPGQRAVLGDRDWAWVDQHMQGNIDHLLIGTSLPFLLPRGLHHLEAWNEAVCDGAWGKRATHVGEAIRQAVDLEHWAAFQHSFAAVAELVTDVATSRRGAQPATITFLSGDVHFSYLAKAELRAGSPPASPIHQAVCSPIRNPLSRTMRWANGAAAFGLAGLVGRALARAAGVPKPGLDWRFTHGPWFDNVLATLDLCGRSARISWHTATINDQGATSLSEVGAASLA